MADAKVQIKGDASDLQRALAVGKASVQDFASSAASAIGTSLQQTTQQLADVALAQGRVNFAGQHASVREFEEATARMGVAAGRDLEGLREQIVSTGVALGKRPQEVEAWAASVGKLTYSYSGAAEAITGINGLAAQTGRSVNDYRGLAVELANVGKVGGDTTQVIGQLAAQAGEMGNKGGIAAFADQVEGLSDTISRFSISSSADFLKVTAAAGELGRGLSPAAAGRVQQGALGAIAADPLRWERYLGREITDKHGQVQDPAQVLREITEKTKSRYGKDARRVLMLNFGAETGAAMYNADFDHAAKAAGLGPSGAPAAAAAAYRGSDAGKRGVAEAELARSSINLLSSSSALGRAADSLQRFSASSPIIGTMVATAASTALGGFLGKFGGSLAGMIKGGSAEGGAVGGITRLAAGAGGSLGLTAAGLGVLGVAAAGGVYLANEFSNEIDRQQDLQENAAVKEQRHKAALARQSAARKTVTARLEAQGIGHGMATYLAGRGVDGGGPMDQQALAKEFRGQGRSADDADKLARALVAAMKDVKLQVNFPRGPQEVASQGAQSEAAGNMSHG